jgi:hypothetical protein
MNDANWNYLGGRETDDEGKCTLGVVAGTYHVGVDRNDLFDRGYAILSDREVSIASGEARVLNFTPQPGLLVAGTVTRQSDGSPIPEAWISAYSGTQTWQWLAGTEAESNGSYRIVLEPGSYKFQAGSNGRLQEFYNEKADNWSEGDVVVLSEQSGAVTGVNFTLEQRATLVVTVLRADTQAAVTSAYVWIYDSLDSIAFAGYVDGKGQYTANVSPGVYRIQVEPYQAGLLGTFHDGKDSLGEADPVTLTDGEYRQVTVQVPTVVSPDCNGDGFIDVEDLLIIRQYWHQTWTK